MARHRPHMPLSVKVEACLILLGLDPKRTEWDHDPALELRPFDETKGDYDPPANDPRFIRPRSPEDHKVKTTGRRGESDLSITFNGDQSRIAKGARVGKEAAEFRTRLLAKEPGKPRQRTGTIRGPSFKPAAPQRTASRPLERRT